MTPKEIEKLNKKFLERKSDHHAKPSIKHPWKGDYRIFTRWKNLNLKDK